ncbi:hypothetical protein N431DRAFT_455027 [Stipitochalara longipes BDJ]|nr:hypothetical protein N431DRAFT_455027 [Stipitochalara longipes BDJ]
MEDLSKDGQESDVKRPPKRAAVGDGISAGSGSPFRIQLAQNSPNTPPIVKSDQQPSVLENYNIVLQPESRPISQEQLVAEVKGIYAGLVMVEAKCIEVDNKQATLAQTDPGAQPKLNNEQWQALIALHRTLLHEHHDFFLASRHPSASPALRRLASKYAMPARMWRHGIHSFLELLRHRLPASLDHMLAFIYLAYSMMALLYETVPAFEDTWIECLGDLGRYRMAIEDEDIRDREVWTGVARHWYSKASDKAPTTGRLYHHLAILARPRPNALQQLFYYAKSLCGIFPSGRESILTDRFEHTLKELLSDTQIGRVTRKFMEQGYPIAVPNTTSRRGIKGNPFLKATQTMTKHISRFVKGIFSTPFRWSFNLLGEPSHRLEGLLGDNVPMQALPDIGSTHNIINEEWAKTHGFSIQTGRENCGIVQFPDGTTAATTGRIYTTITLAGDDTIPIVFEVLPNCYVPVVLGEDFVFDNAIFSNYADSLHEVEGLDCSDDLLLMDYQQPWYATVADKAKLLLQPKLWKHRTRRGPQPQKVPNDFTELERQHQWDIKHLYGKDAPTTEWDAEHDRRKAHELRKYPHWRLGPNQKLIKHDPKVTASYPKSKADSSQGHVMFGAEEAALWRAERPAGMP